MGKTSKWIRNFLTGKKPRGPGGNTSNEDSSFSTDFPTTPIAAPPNTPKEKKRWSFRRSATTTKDFSSMDSIATTPRSVMKSMSGSQKELGQHSLVVAIPAAEAPASAIRRAADSHRRRSSALHEAAATMIQAVFRSYLARKALCALKGLVKLQALVRGHLVRKQAVTTLRCMQALVNVQTRTRAQRIQMVEEAQLHTQRSSNYRTALQESRFRQTQNTDRQLEDKIKVVEMDIGEPKGSASKRNGYFTNNHIGSAEQRSLQCHTDLKQDYHYQISPALSAFTDMSPKARSGNLDEYSLSTERSSPHCYTTPVKQDPTRVPCSCPQPYIDSVSHDHTFFPNYMANTESFKAKARSQSAPKQRLDMFERQSSKKKASMEGRNALRPIRMQRSSSHVSSAAQGNQLSWSIKLDRSAVSLKGSECGSTSTVLTNPNYSRSLAAYEVSNY